MLLTQTLFYLHVQPAGVYIDATLGGGGHAEEILKKLGASGKLIGMDADPDALAYASIRLSSYHDRVKFVHSRFGCLKTVLSQLKVSKISGILFDLGVSSHQLDRPEKGFTYRVEATLDMRMDPGDELDAKAVVNTYSVNALADIFWTYGEERHGRRIAKAIGLSRERAVIETTTQLASIVEQVVGTRNLTKSLARIFQALRIEVNKELDQLKQTLADAIDMLEHTGRIVVISYHSLEDRIVKEFFKQEAATTLPSTNRIEPQRVRDPRLKILTKTPIQPDAEEIRSNPRARSAKLRAAEKV